MTKFTPYMGKNKRIYNAFIYTIYSNFFFFENIGKKSSFRHKPRFYKGLALIISSFSRQISSLNP